MPRVVVVLGDKSSGASVITHMLSELGFFIGDNVNHDMVDTCFSDITSEVLKKKKQVNDESWKVECSSKVQEVINKRNDDHDKWGFYTYDTHRVYDAIDDYLERPKLIMCFDSVVDRIVDGETSASIFESLNALLNVYDEHSNKQRLLIKKSNIVSNPRQVLLDVADFVCVPRPSTITQKSVEQKTTELMKK